METAGLKQTVDMCGGNSASQLTHMHTETCIHTYIHTCMERGQCFSDEKPVCLFHIPLVPGATSEGRKSTQTFLQDADVRIKSQTDSCTQQGRKTEKKKRKGESKRRERIYAGYREKARLHLFQHPVCWHLRKHYTVLQQNLQFPANRGLIHWLVFPSTPIILYVFTVLRAIVAILTFCSLAARLMGNHAPCCLHLVPCFSY